eukprot:3143553-Pyramimonas_sp.AAC.1
MASLLGAVPASVGKKGIESGTLPCASAKCFSTSLAWLTAQWYGHPCGAIAVQTQAQVREVDKAIGSALDPGSNQVTRLFARSTLTFLHRVKDASISLRRKKTARAA